MVKTDPSVPNRFDQYPKAIKPKLALLRQLILETAENIETITEVEETLKWGEPSYLVKKGSTIRIDWKERTPNQYAMYFKCTSKLVPTFRKRFKEQFQFEKNRAILFELEQELPQKALKECIQLALTYHLIKDQL
ncbi:MAG: DUF1801 domain-containing protein [Bacteroidota bacterium]